MNLTNGHINMTPEEKTELIAMFGKHLDQRESAFRLSEKEHYDDHTDLKAMVQLFKVVKGLTLKAFVGLAVIGTFVLALFGIGKYH